MKSTEQPLAHTVGRRTFLRVLGSSAPAAAVAACAPAGPEQIISYVVQPEDIVPGVSTWYSTVCGECPAGCGLRVKTREGRAIKIEGNPEHPVNRGRLCIRGQAALQGLYNPDRFTGPQRRRLADTNGNSTLEPLEWDGAEAELLARARAARADGRTGRIAIVTPLLTGTMDRLIDDWAAAVGARRLRFEPFAYETVRQANVRTFGSQDVPHFDLVTPQLIVSFGADVHETWLSTVQYSHDVMQGRRERSGGDARFVQLESRPSLTGATADRRIELAPGTEGLVAAAMVHTILSEDRTLARGLSPRTTGQILELVRGRAPEDVAERTGVAADTIRSLARRFADPTNGPGRSVAIGGGVTATGETATSTLVAVNLLNYVAGNIGTTVIFDETAPGDPHTTGWASASRYGELAELVEDMRSGAIDLLLLHDVNPVHAAPNGSDFAAALGSVDTVISTSTCPDETTAYADLVLPTHTSLESWGDVSPRRGVRGLMQPVVSPVFDTKHLGDVLLAVGQALGSEVAAALPPEKTFFELLRTGWRAQQAPPGAPAEGSTPSEEAFETFWAETQQRGGMWSAVPPREVTLDPAVLDSVLNLDPSQPTRALELVVYPSLHFYDGRGANRPWLQEVPDPLTKITWSSWAELSPQTAASIGVEDGQLLGLESDHGEVDATVIINPQLRAGVIAMPLGQGHTQYGRYASNRGVNPTILLDPRPDDDADGPRWLGTSVDATPRAVRRPVPRMQTTFTQEGRGIAQAVSVATLDGRPATEDSGVAHTSLYPDHPHPVHRWGMAIDLDACTGCNACVAACYAENNVPVLGAEAMRRGRTMSWLRIDRFMGDDAEGGDDRFLPMLCQQCDHAPCETVCPTHATYHTDEGLNAQIYNRCVGTRYCANNCPYKVRRFNWSTPEIPRPLEQQLNPDVTTRSAGVVEKCSFCVQRIREVQDRARDDGRMPQDGEITPACAQTCPAEAIVFGDLNDPNSRVSQLAGDQRAYRVLEQLNTRPAVTYLKKIQRT